ncbi:MAG TPA: CpsB/CapC family capsule biosynthesis tyrosine phosphatase [Solirubrobacteraceae bacterium]|nr:CpsB/CapC family capsule biosynthesis tyrosine phosphatase [Solirubrobacteraceae bacterium]
MAYVDLHCHLLPGLDDGAPEMVDTLVHARRLAAAGVMDVACTPHIKRVDFPDIDVRALAGLRAEAQALIDAEGLGVRLHRGGELAHEEVPVRGADELELIAQGPDHAPWLLLETPFEGVRQDFVEATERLWELGYGVLIAHPERSAGISGAEARIDSLIARGALVQVNSTSLLGHHGPAAQARAVQLVRRGVVWCLASDGHPGTRETTLDRGHEVLVRMGADAGRLTRDNPRTLLLDGLPALGEIAA